ncbi:MAG: molybdopterin-binding protein [Microthrixaceae bacterium]
MIPLAEAQAYVLDRVPPQPETTVALSRRSRPGRHQRRHGDGGRPGLGQHRASTASPCSHVDLAGVTTELDVVGTVAAGDDSDLTVSSGTAIRIMTGAPIPPGADAVVMVERTTALDGGSRVRVEGTVGEGDGIRRAGEDVRVGDVAVAAGTALGVGHLGLLASIGVTRLDVRRRPVVGVLSTGDELVAGGAPLRRGQVRDSNRLALVALCRSSGLDVVDLGLIPDDERPHRTGHP